MVNKCCVPGCRSNYRSKKKSVPFIKVTAFHIPREQKLKEEWLRKIPVEFTVTKHTVVCEKHFEEDDIIRYKQNKSKNAPDVKVSWQHNIINVCLLIIVWLFWLIYHSTTML